VKSAGRKDLPGRRPGRAALLPFLRLGAFAVLVSVSVAALALRAARADVDEALWAMGTGTLAFPGAPSEEVRRLHLNGVRFSFRTRTVDASLDDVLDHYETTCGAAIATQTARNGAAGYVACLDLGSAPLGLGEIVSRFVRFAETGDLLEVGAPRYVLARRAADGAPSKVLLLTVWADAQFNLYRMLPRPGADAVGVDLDGVPRPPGSRRVLSAWEERRPSGVFVYRVPLMSAQELESFYRAELLGAGWRVIERNPGESVRVDDIHTLSARKGSRVVTVIRRAGDADPTVVTILASEPS
jgi:hypothetical protein